VAAVPSELSLIPLRILIINLLEDVRIADSIIDNQESTINVCWGKVWPEAITEFTVLPCIGDALQDIVQLAHEIAIEGFEDVQPQGIQ
jgi:hypothetical protein